LTNLSRDFFV